MKTFKQHIFEKLKISKSAYTLFPKSKDELKHMIEDEISKNGDKCSLNHIDVSKITDMCDIFFDSKFNGDISEWDVSNVEDMEGMFYKAKFNGDISNWDVSNVRNMYAMLCFIKLNLMGIYLIGMFQMLKIWHICLITTLDLMEIYLNGMYQM